MSRIGIVGAIVIVALVALLLALRSCGYNHQRAEQGKQDTRSSEALAETARNAAATVIERASDEATIDQLVAAATKEIDNAPSDEAAGAAARRAICSLPDYRGDPACGVRPVHP